MRNGTWKKAISGLFNQSAKVVRSVLTIQLAEGKPTEVVHLEDFVFVTKVSQVQLAGLMQVSTITNRANLCQLVSDVSKGIQTGGCTINVLVSQIGLFLSGSNIYIPQSLLVVISLIVVGFLFSMIGTVRDKAKARAYQKIGGPSAMEANPNTDLKSYQNSTEYALPPKQNVVTYCVVDPRLVQQ
jgi:hypothetical protein